MVLRDFEGRTFYGDGDRLRPCSESEFEARIATILETPESITYKKSQRVLDLPNQNIRIHGRKRTSDLHRLLAEMPPGSYLAVFGSLPWLCE